MAQGNISDDPRMVVIGAGGIGSWFCPRLSKMVEGDQFDNLCKSGIIIYDPDVVEEKNMRHQAFFDGEEGLPKAAIMKLRYNFDMRVARFGKEHLTSFNWYIICADNTAVRKLVFEHVAAANKDRKTPAKKFIDMRAEGSTLAIFTYKCGIEALMSSLGKEPESEQGFSCQLPSDTAVGQVNEAYDIVGGIGIQLLLNDFRGVEIPDTIMHDVVVPASVRR